jgi:hypothetical protein
MDLHELVPPRNANWVFFPENPTLHPNPETLDFQLLAQQFSNHSIISRYELQIVFLLPRPGFLGIVLPRIFPRGKARFHFSTRKPCGGGYPLSEQRHEERDPQQISNDPIYVAEILRNSVSKKDDEKAKNGEERVSPFWKIFGGTLLSIGALVVLTICQYFNSTLNDLRGEVGRVNDEIRKDISHSNQDMRKDINRLIEANAELVKKDDFSSRMKSVWDSLKELQSMSVVVAGLKEQAILRDQQLKDHSERQELLKELHLLRERLANLEGKQSAAGSVKTAVHRDNN